MPIHVHSVVISIRNTWRFHEIDLKLFNLPVYVFVHSALSSPPSCTHARNTFHSQREGMDAAIFIFQARGAPPLVILWGHLVLGHIENMSLILLWCISVLFSIIIWVQAPKPPFTVRNKPILVIIYTWTSCQIHFQHTLWKMLLWHILK